MEWSSDLEEALQQSIASLEMEGFTVTLEEAEDIRQWLLGNCTDEDIFDKITGKQL